MIFSGRTAADYKKGVDIYMLFRTKRSRAYVLLIIDSILHIVSMLLSGAMRHGFFAFLEGWFQRPAYIATMTLIVLFYALIFIGKEEARQDIMEQGPFSYTVDVVKSQMGLFLFILFFLFITKQGQEVSRYIILVFSFIDIVLECAVRFLYIRFLRHYMRNNISAERVLLVTISDRAKEILNHIYEKRGDLQNITAVVLLDGGSESSVMGIPVVGNRDNILSTHKENVYDEVFIHIPYDYPVPLESIIMGFEQMGVPVNLNIDVFNLAVEEKAITSFGPYNVIAFKPNSQKLIPMICKRLIDIVGSMAGLFVTGILTLILAPVIKIQSPGPVFFSQVRVGINGRKFKMYKFRSMYQEAEQEKAALMEQNEMQGFMFKMKDDPRVTPVGRFIRRTSLDEFPQFLNVLKGDMSLVGTRPPTLDEYVRYETHHLKRLSIKPGITGLWQVSGRNQVKNFEDVVKLDFRYIDQWSLLLDVKIILQTIGVIFGREKEWKNACCILGVNISVVNMADTIRMITENLREWSGKYICVANVHTTVMSYEDETYRAVQNGAVMVLPDGKPLSVVARKRGCQTIGRVAGPDLMGEIFRISVSHGYRHFFYGSSEETLERLRAKLSVSYPGLEIVGMISPPFRALTEDEDRNYIQEINASGADFVWIGLGAPKQETYMASHEGKVKGLMIGVGAGFDYYAGNIRRAPLWMQKCSLEWLYRLIQEPRKLLKRYVHTNGKFIRLVWKENRDLRHRDRKIQR